MNGGTAGEFADWEQRVRAIGWARTPDGCWAWLGERLPNGRARVRMRVNGKTERRYPYRILYEAEHGPIPAGLVACHTCDHPWCVNPAHIIAGTQSDNMAGVVRPTGAANPRWFDKREQVLEEWNAGGVTQSELAEKYGLHRVSVNRIIKGIPTNGRTRRAS